MDLQLQSLTETLDQADHRVRAGGDAADRVWPTGFDVLDANLHGGFRSGDLVLLGGPQGMGKTTWVLQVARNVARQGRPVVYFCYEHDQTTMLIRLVALEAGLIAGMEAPSINRVRSIFETTDGLGRGLASGSPTPRAARRASTSSRSTPTGSASTAPPGRAPPWTRSSAPSSR